MRNSSLAVAAALLVLAQPAAAATYTFQQTGWYDAALNPQPGTLTFSFTGADSNADAYLTYGFPGSPNEVSAFSLSWSGNSVLPAFSYGAVGNLLALVFPLGTLSFSGSDSVVIAIDSATFSLSGGAFSSGCSGANLCGYLASATAALVSATTPTLVPEPLGLGLLGVGLAGLASVARRRA